MNNHNTHTCQVCGSTVTDLVSIKVENDNVIKLGKFFKIILFLMFLLNLDY